MPLTIEEVQRVAVLARLQWGPDEVERIATQLNRIVGYVDELQKVDTAGVEPMSHPLPLTNVFRADEPRASLDREAALANAPARNRDCFLVPPVLE